MGNLPAAGSARVLDAMSASHPTLGRSTAAEPRVGWSAHRRAVWRTRWLLTFAGFTVTIADVRAAPLDLIAFDGHGLDVIAVHVVTRCRSGSRRH
jgi:hypothetical protein